MNLRASTTEAGPAPIIPTEGMGGLGRIRPRTRLAVRRATEQELAVQWQRLWLRDADLLDPKREPNPDYRLQASAYLVVLADDPSQTLHDWFSPVGHWLLEYAVKDARKYAVARGAEYVGLLMPLLWQDAGDQA